MRESIAPFKNKPMVVLIRDGKDALTSYFFHQKFRTGRQKYHSTIDDFVRSPVYGIEKFISYYNVLAETRMSSRAPTLITRYEELWYHCNSVMLKNLEFMGVTGVSEEMVGHATASCSIEKMRSMELASTSENALVPGLFKVANDQPEAMKVRKGGIGNWRDCLSDSVADEIDHQLESKLNPFFSYSNSASFRTY
jgi:alcohol sulfotransferase